jgi:phosphoglycolate phosphatase
MDGTLIDSGNVISNTINFVRTNIGLCSMPKNELLSNLNNPEINSSEFFYGTDAFTAIQTELFGKYYDEHCISDIVLYDGIENMLKNISEYFILTIATNASVEFAKKMIKYLNIDNYFDFIIGSNCVQNPKPHPDMLLKTIDKFRIDKTNTILVGDSHKDTRAANAAGIDNILVNWGFTTHYNNIAIDNTTELTNRLLSFR